MTFKNALNSVQSLVNVQDHVKNYRPLVLVLSGRPSSRPTLVDFTHLISKGNGMLVCGHIIQVKTPLLYIHTVDIKDNSKDVKYRSIALSSDFDTFPLHTHTHT